VRDFPYAVPVRSFFQPCCMLSLRTRQAGYIEAWIYQAVS
jgi:hypothetical protein